MLCATFAAKRPRLPTTIAERIVQLDERLCLEDPPRAGRDVAAEGSCFFLSANLARQELGMAPPTAGEAELEMAGQTAVIDYIVKYIGKPEGRSDTDDPV